MSAPIDFYFDFSSPYGYFGSLHIEKLATQYGRTVNWHGILLGPAFKLMSTAPLVNTPLKGDYSRRDMERTARFHNIYFKQPDAFPIGTQNAARALLWIQQNDAAKAVTFIHTIYSAYFTETSTSAAMPPCCASPATSVSILRPSAQRWKTTPSRSSSRMK